VLDALHAGARAQAAREDRQFGAAQPLAGGRRRADGAVILHQQPGPALLLGTRHVALAGAQLRQAAHARAQRREAGQRRGVLGLLLLLACRHQAVEGVRPQHGRGVADQLHGQVGVAVGKARVAGLGQQPAPRRAAALVGHVLVGQHAFFLPRLELAARAHRRQLQQRGQLLRRLRAARLDQE
jgi:hypothetical protein